MIDKYGSYVTGWRNVFDAEDKGRVGQMEFIKAMREINFAGNLLKLWKELDADGSGFITLEEFDEESSKELDYFRDLCAHRHGNLLKAWMDIFDLDGSGRCERDHFGEACVIALGYDGDIEKLWAMLKRDPTQGFLTLDAFDFTANRCFYMGDYDMRSFPKMKRPKDPKFRPRSDDDEKEFESDLRRMKSRHTKARMTKQLTFFIRQEESANLAGADQRVELEAQRRKTKMLDKAGTGDLQSLIKMFKHKYGGNFFRAWRECLDPTDRQTIGFIDFSIACRNIGFQGQYKQIWKTLDTDGGGTVTLFEFAPEIHKLITSFKDALKQSAGGSLIKGWLKHLDTDKSGRVSEEEVIEACTNGKLKEYFEGNPKQLFGLLDFSHSGVITLERLDPKAYRAMQRGDHLTGLDVIEDAPRQSIRNLTFFERQVTGADRRRSILGAAQRKDIADENAARKAADVQASDLAGFRKQLMRKYAGNLLKAWRLGLDLDGGGTLSYIEFCQAVRHQGYVGDMKKLWSEMDTDGSGFIALDEFAPAVAAATSELFEKMRAACAGSLINCWIKKFDKSNSGRVSLEKFSKACEEIGVTADPEKLFGYFDFNNTGSLTLELLDPAQHAAMVRGDHELGLDVEQVAEDRSRLSLADRLSGQTAAARRSEAQGRAKKEARAAQEKKARELDMAASDLPSFKKALMRKYGNLYRAWKEALDLDGSGSLGFTEFAMAARGVGFIGPIKKIFEELDADKEGIITLDEFAPDVFRIVTTFKGLMKQKFKSIARAWLAMDRKKALQLNVEEFAESCKNVLEYEGDAVKVFQLFDFDYSGTIGLHEIDPEAYEQIGRGDVEAGLDLVAEEIAEMKGGTRASMMTFDERNKIMNARRAQAGKHQREAVNRDIAEKKKKDVQASDLDGFIKQLITRYGNLMRAWKHGLDTDGGGSLSFAEFCASARNQGYSGNLKQLFAELDKDDSGFIGLEELEPVAAAMMTEFREAMKQVGQGSMIKAWKQHFDPDRSGQCPKEDFVKACEAIGFSGNAEKVFSWLDYDHSGNVSLEEIDGDAYEAMERGDDLLGLDVQVDTRRKSEMTFEERSMVANRRNQALGKAKKEKLEKERKARQAQDMAASDLKSFRAALIRKYGNLLRAWHISLDTGKRGKIGFTEFATQMRNEGFNGDVNAIWKDLDSDGGGLVSIDELAPKEGKMLLDFKSLLKAKFGSILRGWVEGLDTDRSGTLTLEEFQRSCAAIEGFEGDAAKIFTWLDFDYSGSLSLEELDEKAHEAMMRGDYELGLDLAPEGPDDTSNLSFADRQQTSTSLRQQAVGKARKVSIEIKAAAEMKAQAGASTLKEFKEALIKKYRTLLFGWRTAFDSDGSGRLGKAEFTIAARGEGYIGNLNELFKEIDVENRGSVTVYELVPAAATTISTFKAALLEKHESVTAGWDALIDLARTGKVAAEEFSSAGGTLGLEPSVSEALFTWLDAEVRGEVTFMEFLREVDPPAYKNKVYKDKGAGHMIKRKSGLRQQLDTLEPLSPLDESDVSTSRRKNSKGSVPPPVVQIPELLPAEEPAAAPAEKPVEVPEELAEGEDVAGAEEAVAPAEAAAAPAPE
jgi:Ca2+-binding EF-hand superfamily protein